MSTTSQLSAMDIHAAVYARQSDARENASEVSTTVQREQGYAEAERRSASSITYYEDLGISAFTGVERPDFEKLLKDCRAGKINLLIVYYISRLSRLEPEDAIPIVVELLGLGVTIVSVTEGEFRKGNLLDLIHMLMRLDQSHNESKNKSQAVREAKAKAESLGGYLGGKPPYGFALQEETRYTADDRPIAIQLLVHNRDEAEVIRRVWATIKQHMDEPYDPKSKRHPGSLNGIVSDMNNGDEPVPTRGAVTGKKTKDSAWDPKTLKRILRDPRIAGFAAEPIYNVKDDGTATSQVESYRILRDPGTMLPLQRHEPIIPSADWHELQTWLDSRGRGKGLSRGQSLLSAMDVLFCECGSVKTSHADSAKPVKRSYRCRRRKVQPGQHLGECTISQAALDDHVARSIFALLREVEHDHEALAVLAEATRRFGVATESPERARERAALIADRADAARALEELYDDRKAGGFRSDIGRRRFIAEEDALVNLLEATEARLAVLEEAITPVIPIGEWLPEDPAVDPIGPGSWWHGTPIDGQRTFVRLFVDRITVSKSEQRGGRGPVHQRVRIDFAKRQETAENGEGQRVV
ncbi:recombinase family protein [Kitasatospora viridis]|uniref:DNA invertase Pin-like site-specific DNA recombinase n=1 Tax=Kitasatospora viridis TaxID=281105 RepID=A0A561UGW4_9ACTN|nr:recombinase family protein [Kitasatospora viridis]TWF98602.1 DNA invertase Pin-like site-specific DNA recombinase [Kitasatospora viridis]